MKNESEDINALERLGEARDAIVTELRKTIVGMDDVIDEMMIA
ncbi:MAG: AAA family ATPase, partial [Verrucomicrobiaceae bacterium]|nr:AAA family ATPase [Verrucomicrobiaceae bacterium]